MLVFHTAWAHNGIHLWAESTSDARLALNDLLGSRGREIHAGEDLEEAFEEIESATTERDAEAPTPGADASNNAARQLNSIPTVNHAYAASPTALESLLLKAGVITEEMIVD